MWRTEIIDGTKLDTEEVAALYVASTLAERRPVGDRERFTAMLRNANLIAVAYQDDQLIGISRSLTDWSYATYLCDIAVDRRFQRQGVGKDLIRATQEAAPAAKIVLLSAPAATGYYPRVGFKQHNSAWVLDPIAES
ncbi:MULTISPECIES: GNAT family N-acetyltransferase [unclassified Micromonospora]|uniref:GNAT family N-acetyltransferase n=1 Tax=unclassified Micromonospora TaxID=2617518 RepID=UPI00249CBB02|nr:MULTISPECIES: GNAT family N-acetyltransferase [unclassified Micromonospora]WFE54840.1 GNAT family N-acetyltransferase [Micromonospora sp. WMMD1155]WFE98638.1 GNAT family N-acetyltransferase [Micromonospora sp. WMMD964]